MPGRSGIEALQQIKTEYPKLPVLVLSGHTEEQYALRALKAGASGCLNKDAAPEELLHQFVVFYRAKNILRPILLTN